MRSKNIILVIFFVFCAISPSSFAQQKGQLKLVRFAYTGGWDALPALIAIERGFFAEQGLVVSPLPTGNNTTVLESLAAGSTDFALVTQRMMLLLATSKADFNIIGIGGWGSYMVLLVPETDKKTKKLTDLKGKKIAVVRDGEALPILVRLLNREKMRPTDVQILSQRPRELTDAFKGGKIDGALVVGHLGEALRRNANARPILDNRQISRSIGRINAMPVLVNGKMLKEEKDTVQKFANAWARALNHLRQSPKDTAAVLSIFFHRQGVRVPLPAATVWTRLARYDRYAWNKSDIADAEYNGWALKTVGIIKTQPKIGKYVRNEFMQKAMKQYPYTSRKNSKKK